MMHQSDHFSFRWTRFSHLDVNSHFRSMRQMLRGKYLAIDRAGRGQQMFADCQDERVPKVGSPKVSNH